MSDTEDYLADYGNSRKKKERLKKHIKDEYSSESSGEEDQEDVNPKIEGLGDEDNSDSDMFASDDEKEPAEPEKTPKKSKEPKKLDMRQFEKEAEIEVSNANQNSDSEVEIETFDLRKEEEEGYFDEDGNYIRREQSDSEEEEWTNSNKSEIRKAKEAQEKQLSSKFNKAPIETTAELASILINIMETAESVMETFARLAPAKKKRSKAKLTITEGEAKNKLLITEMTEVCDKLIIHKKLLDVYEMTREELMRLYKQETGEEFIQNRGTKRSLSDTEDENPLASEPENSAEPDVDNLPKIWEFKWDGLDDINGPYSEYEMGYWKQEYFENNVWVRKLGDSEFMHVSEVEFE